MIGNEYPRATGCLGLGQEFYKSLKEIFPILVDSEYLTTLYLTDHDVMQYTISLPEASSRANLGIIRLYNIKYSIYPRVYTRGTPKALA